MAKPKSNMEIWAENEIRIACEKCYAEVGDEWNYGAACYESALKAFRSLLEDECDGMMSIHIVKDILNSLIDGKPLTPIEDTEDVWERVPTYSNAYAAYQCKRMSSLFKEVYDDGRVKYADVKRFRCRYIGNPEIGSFYDRQIDEIMGGIFPIEFPYVSETYTVWLQEYLTDRKNGDCDTLEISYVDKDRDAWGIHRYFKKTEDSWEEICEGDWRKRVQLHKEREMKEAERNE